MVRTAQIPRNLPEDSFHHSKFYCIGSSLSETHKHRKPMHEFLSPLCTYFLSPLCAYLLSPSCTFLLISLVHLILVSLVHLLLISLVHLLTIALTWPAAPFALSCWNPVPGGYFCGMLRFISRPSGCICSNFSRILCFEYKE